MDVLVLIGRIMMAPLFLSSAYAHLAQSEALAGYAVAKGVPKGRARFWVLLGGVALALGGLSVLLGIWIDLGALALFAFLVPTALVMHGFWRESDPQNRQMEQIQFSKDIGLAGAMLALLGLVVIAGNDLGLTITGPAFTLR